MNTYALDFETYYDGDCSIKTLGSRGYFSHPSFDAYLMSVVGTDGTRFCGHPKDFDWDILRQNRILSHNASFDQNLYFYGVEQGWWSSVEFAEWHCTADMVAALGLPRSLKNASAVVLEVEADKSVRDNMKGKTWNSMSKEFQDEVIEYALKDSEYCLQLWEKLSDKWSQTERDISKMNREICQRGIPIDVKLLEESIQSLKTLMFDSESSIPWAGERPLLSRKAFDEHCISLGIEPPASLAASDVDAQEWIRQYGHKYQWVEAVTNWRRLNTLKKKLESFDLATMPNQRYYGNLMYFGGHTGRFSGSGGNLNLQNLPRDEMFGVNVRKLIATPKGRVLVVCDLSNIEVRTLSWLAGDKATLETIRQTPDIYEAFALRFGLWDTEKGSLKDDPKLRHRVKALVLGCGYGAGGETFARLFDLPIEEATEAVNLYRKRLPKIPKYWRDLSDDINAAYSIQCPYVVQLPSGRELNYGQIRMAKSNNKRPQPVAIMNRNGKRLPMKLWGGIIAENCSQAMARDVLCHMMLEMERQGLNIILHVHDEIIVECDEKDAEDTLAKMKEIMSTPPSWCDDLPLSSEGYISQYYKK